MLPYLLASFVCLPSYLIAFGWICL
jgi:hypothetical protein